MGKYVPVHKVFPAVPVRSDKSFLIEVLEDESWSITSSVPECHCHRVSPLNKMAVTFMTVSYKNVIPAHWWETGSCNPSQVR